MKKQQASKKKYIRLGCAVLILILILAMVSCKACRNTAVPVESTAAATDAVETIEVETSAPETTEQTEVPAETTSATETEPTETEPVETVPSTEPVPSHAPDSGKEDKQEPEVKPTEPKTPETKPAETTPQVKPTEPKPTEPKVPETQPSHSEENETTAPTTCQHSWQEVHHAEKGHEETFVVCKCGYRCKSTTEWIAHNNSYSAEDALLYHTSYGDTTSYVVDSPAYTEWVCSKCGAATTSKP